MCVCVMCDVAGSLFCVRTGRTAALSDRMRLIMCRASEAEAIVCRCVRPFGDQLTQLVLRCSFVVPHSFLVRLELFDEQCLHSRIKCLSGYLYISAKFLSRREKRSAVIDALTGRKQR